MPEAAAMAASPPSREASFSSTAPRVGVAQTGVDISALLAGEPGAALLDGGECEGGGLIDGGAQGARRVFHVAGVDLTRGKTELFLRVHTVDLPFFTGPSGDAPQGQN